MDVDRFDQFTLAFATLLSRRGALTVAGTGLGGLAALARLELDPFSSVEARRRKKRKGKKSCRNGKAKCNGKCRDLNSNDNNCGSCGNACGPGETCQNGNCTGNGCNPNCAGAACGDSDGCGETCDGACPPGADVTCDVDTGTCECSNPGNCCFDADCAELGPNFACLSVNNVNNCFCDPDLLCGPVGNRVCCNVGQTCNSNTNTCVP